MPSKHPLSLQGPDVEPIPLVPAKSGEREKSDELSAV